MNSHRDVFLSLLCINVVVAAAVAVVDVVATNASKYSQNDLLGLTLKLSWNLLIWANPNILSK